MIYAIAIFFSAFLLFQIQPLIARFILPWNGGTQAVWSTCLLFFQVGLLLGYSYAHLISKYLSPRKQIGTHLLLLGLSLFLMPIIPDAANKPTDANSPVLGIIMLLLTTVGLPYILISSTAPLLQKWFENTYPLKSPYRLYALSNLGSLLGLLTYPFLIEPNLGLNTQAIVWSIGYGFAFCTCGCAGWALYKSSPKNLAPHQVAPSTLNASNKMNLLDPFLWIALSACGSVILLAATNFICQDVAVIPFLWILPLSLYLITFIIAFDNPRWYVRWFWIPALILIVPKIFELLELHYALKDVDLTVQMATYLGGMFIASMVCHGEIVRLKPSTKHLTFFYLMVSTGGALGGIFVTLVAPRIFSDFWEWPLGLVTTMLLAAMSFLRKPAIQTSWVHRYFPVNKPILKHTLAFCTVLMMAGIPLYFGMKIPELVKEFSDGVLANNRNFYGVIRVIESGKGTSTHRYKLYHGQINHGIQFQYPDMMREPTTYYSEHSGIGLAIRRHPKRLNDQGIKLGVVGLGSGTIATYFKPEDLFVYYEIDPDVELLARKYFTYLNDVGDHMEVVLGDGRISLEREFKNTGSRHFDILAVDAFSGDAIPIHLLTREAFELYLKHLNPDGILAIHISNLHFNLDPLIHHLGKEFEMSSILVEESSDRSNGIKRSSWVLLTNNQLFLQHYRVQAYVTPWPKEVLDSKILWTDDYSNVVELLK